MIVAAAVLGAFKWELWVPVIIAAAVGVPGAVWATIALHDRFARARRDVRVDVSYGYVAIDGLGSRKVIIEARNHGTRVVTLSGAGIVLPNKNQLFIVKQSYGGIPLPVNYGDLLPGKSFTVWMEGAHVARELKEGGSSGKVAVRGFFKDALGERYVSKVLKFDLNADYEDETLATPEMGDLTP